MDHRVTHRHKLYLDAAEQFTIEYHYGSVPGRTRQSVITELTWSIDDPEPPYGQNTLVCLAGRVLRKDGSTGRVSYNWTDAGYQRDLWEAIPDKLKAAMINRGLTVREPAR